MKRFIKVFKALANEERIEIIRLLNKHKEMCAQEVEKHFFLEQSTTSHHLNTLRRAGITNARKDGRRVFYSINREEFLSLWDNFSKLLV
jgi:DNA-binding transcriptional ArsR family regulator